MIILKRKIFFIINVFEDEKINNYKKKYDEIKNELINLSIQSQIQSNEVNTFNNLDLKNNIIKSNTSKNKFIGMVKKAKKYIKIGDIFQVVLSQRFETKLTKKPLDIYKKLRTTNPSPFMYFFNFP